MQYFSLRLLESLNKEFQRKCSSAKVNMYVCILVQKMRFVHLIEFLINCGALYVKTISVVDT